MLVMLDCISVYQRFYVEFLKTKIFDFDSSEIKGHLARMSIRATSGGSSDAESFEEETVIEGLRSNCVPLRSNEIFALQDAIKFCCEILVELSSIPTWIDQESRLVQAFLKPYFDNELSEILIFFLEKFGLEFWKNSGLSFGIIAK